MKLIVEMDMPKCCDDCDANYDSCACGISRKAWYRNPRCPGFDPGKERMPDCPIKGVLPEEHGDLIDRDVLFLKYREQYDFVDEEDILSAKAIIAAERKDDGDI